MLRPIQPQEFSVVLALINEAAQAYRGAIPEDRWHDPYMTAKYLRDEIGAGVRFYGYEADGELLGVMGIQDVKDVTLIRHAYVSPRAQRHGIGGKLLQYLQTLTPKPILIGTWRAATWALCFYQRHGFALASEEEKTSLLRTYWTVPERQIETSVVLTDTRWRNRVLRPPGVG